MQVLSLRDGANKLGIGLSTLKRMIAAGEIQKIKISEGRVGIIDAEIDGLIAKRIAERDAEAA